MTRRAIIHIGMPRTASTTIQHILAHRRSGLEAAGILYPDLTPRSAAHEPHINHQHLGEALDGRRPAAEGRELLDALSARLAATAADVVLLSYEDWIQEKRAGRIGGALGEVFARHGFAMEAITVAKPQSEHLNSIYSHRTQLMRERHLFGPFCRGFEGSRRFAYAELMAPWRVVCAGRVRAVPLRDVRSGAPLVDRFLAELGLLDRVGPLLGAEEGTRVENRSPGPVSVEVSRRLRLLRVPSRLPVRPRAAMREVEQRVRAQGFDAVPFKGVGPELRARLHARYATTNERFAHAVWGQGWDSVTAAEPVQPVNELGDQPQDPAIEAVIAETMRMVCTRFDIDQARPWHAPLAEAVEDTAGRLQRQLHLSRWRVT